MSMMRFSRRLTDAPRFPILDKSGGAEDGEGRASTGWAPTPNDITLLKPPRPILWKTGGLGYSS